MVVHAKTWGGASVSEICTAAQVPRRTFYDWWSRYRQHGLDGLKSRSRRPHTIRRTSSQVVEEVISIRQKTGWCLHKIAGYLRIHETTRDPHRSRQPILERPQRRIHVRHLLPRAGDQAHPRRHRQAYNAWQDRTMVPNLRSGTCAIPAPLEIRPILQLRAATHEPKL